VQSLTLEAANDDINPFARIFTSRVFLNVVEGQEYRIAIDGFAGTRGPTVLNWASGTPSNDNFSSAQVLIDQSGTVTGATLFATKELGEPDHAFSLGGHSIWYEWTLPLEGFATIDLSGSTFDTLLAVYTGESVDALTLVTQNDDSLGTPRSRVQFITEPGVTYHIAVDGYAGDQGSVTLTYSNEIVPVVIRTQPQSRDAIVGEQVQFRVTADGIPAHYQWYLNGAAVPGAQIPTLTFTNVQATNAGNYTIVITNALSAVTSSVARLTVSVDLRQAWLARYDGGNDQPAALKVDSNGNVYVTGTSYGGTYNDYATLKYGADGSLLWVARFDGVNGTDAAQDLAIDDVGNVYVTGYSYGGNATGFDIATVKYDAAGVRQWVARYDGPVHGEDVAYALKVDSTGNVYVTGYTTNSGGGIDFATVKYDRNGNQLWAAIYDGPGHGSDYGYDVAVDVAGNVIVTGPSYGGATTTNDYTTIKYGPGGNQLWVARYNGPGNGADIPFRVVLDGAGNPYVTGRSVGSGTGSDYATLKYNSTNGAQMWVARYNGPANNTDFGLRLALDSATNVFVTGVSYGGASNYFDYATVKYSPSGGQLWVSRYTGPGAGFDSPFALVVDGTGNAYVAGYSDGGPDATNDFVTLKYAANGTQLWAARYDGPAHGDDRAWAIAVDSASNV